MPKFDPNAFNTDPKHAEQRDFLDSIVEASAKRLLEKQKKAKPQDDSGIGSFFDFLKTED